MPFPPTALVALLGNVLLSPCAGMPPAVVLPLERQLPSNGRVWLLSRMGAPDGGEVGVAPPGTRRRRLPSGSYQTTRIRPVGTGVAELWLERDGAPWRPWGQSWSYTFSAQVDRTRPEANITAARFGPFDDATCATGEPVVQLSWEGSDDIVMAEVVLITEAGRRERVFLPARSRAFTFGGALPMRDLLVGHWTEMWPPAVDLAGVDHVRVRVRWIDVAGHMSRPVTVELERIEQ